MSVEHLIGCGCGSRRSCAPAVTTSFLNTADLIAVVTEGDSDEPLAERMVRDLQQADGTHVLRVRAADRPGSTAGVFPNGRANPWFGSDLKTLATQFRGSGPADSEVRRSVLLWHGVDEYLLQHPARFDEVAAAIASAIEAPRAPVWRPFQLDRAILIGGPLLRSRLESLSTLLHERLRFRYLLVR